MEDFPEVFPCLSRALEVSVAEAIVTRADVMKFKAEPLDLFKSYYQRRKKTITLIQREKTHLNDLEKRSEQGRRTSLPFSLLDNHGCLTASGPISFSSLFVYMFPSIPYTAELSRFGANSQRDAF
ncbi:hypothetical protein EYF80_004074 [Liparis tanakae]|uniref:Uncharacterized protein n=1 Tax=Liparis tanakae TaxID=230148 RepID=A0A4Z2J722_9TELE|nr:hypothetical protein EYF80_004074 [Liparis tanakae]